MTHAIIESCISLIVAILITAVWAAAGATQPMLCLVFVSQFLLALYVISTRYKYDQDEEKENPK